MALAILAEPDLEKRIPIYKELAKWNRDHYNTVGLFYIPTCYVLSNKTVGEWQRNTAPYYQNWEYIRHATPLNTFRLFDVP